MLNSSLYDYSDAHVLGVGTIIITGAGADAVARQADKRNKQVLLKNNAPFTVCNSIKNNTQRDNAKELNVLMPVYNAIEYNELFKTI